MKISILSPDLSSNSIGRSYLLSKILSKKYSIEIVGPVLGKGVWDPIKSDKSINYKIINSKLDFKDIFSKINGDIIYAIKPLGTSFGYGLLKKLYSKRPIILDIDDWDFGWFLDNKLSLIKSSLVFWKINNSFYTWILERMIKFADGITVSSLFLQKKFGGTIIPHARDTNFLDPKKYNRKNIRKKLGFENEKIIMFFGTIRMHKGIDDLISSIDLLKRKDIILMLVGADFNDPYVQSLNSINKNYIQIYGFQPFEKIPEFLSIADLVVLPQKKTNFSNAQVPAKVFDAMAMAKPIIATDVSDLPKILRGCGLIVKSGDTQSLAKKIKWVLENPDKAKKLGKKAREKCIREYSFDAVAPKLFKIFDKVININKK